MFLGEYTHTVDDKGRLTIPAKYRALLAPGLVVTRGLDRNLVIYPLNEWEALAGRVMARPMTDPAVRAFRRRVFSGAVDLTLDRQGRILLPTYLRDFADLNGDVVIVGNFDYAEIWNRDAWASARNVIENADESVFDIGL